MKIAFTLFSLVKLGKSEVLFDTHGNINSGCARRMHRAAVPHDLYTSLSTPWGQHLGHGGSNLPPAHTSHRKEHISGSEPSQRKPSSLFTSVYTAPWC